VKIPGGAAAAAAGLTKPTRYHYYPHNQHIYLLPECAIQQVGATCNISTPSIDSSIVYMEISFKTRVSCHYGTGRYKAGNGEALQT
jgi:hypothetical protein